MSEGDFVDTKKVASGGYLYLLQAPFIAAAAIEHRPDIPIWSGVVAGAAQANIDRCIRNCNKEDDKNQRDASTMHRALNSPLSINS
jgi:hypothetical protein